MILLDDIEFRDLDHDGVVSPYEDHRLSVAERVDDLMGRLRLEEKAGLMLHGTLPAIGEFGVAGIGDTYDGDAIRALILDGNVTSAISRLAPTPGELAEQHNALQAVAAEGRLGIPLTISTDPRNHLRGMFGASVDSTDVTIWPGWLGLGAIGDADVVYEFGDIVRGEYRATGIHMALSPQADLATEPRWPRASGCFGSDPAEVRRLVGAFVRGIQGGEAGLASDGVAAIVKHWVGYGASRDGFDGHNYYGRFSAFPAGRFDDHVAAFLDAFAAGVAGVMPTYNILDGLALDGPDGRHVIEPVGAGFSTELLQHLLRGVHGYDGLVVSDWAITKDLNAAARTGVPTQTPLDISMAWGVDHLSRTERYAKGINAGIDQFGGEDQTAPLLDAVEQGWVSEARIDESVRRVLTQKFELGLFDDPFVDVGAVDGIVGDPAHHRAAREARRRSYVVLDGTAADVVTGARGVWVHGVDAAAFTASGITVVDDLATADAAVVRLDAPHEVLHPNFFFGQMQHEGSLDFPDDGEALGLLDSIPDTVRTVVVVHLDRPAILTRIRPHADVLIADFGSDDGTLAEILLGGTTDGRLPVELPRDMASVLAHPVDQPGGLAEPLYPRGHRAD